MSFMMYVYNINIKEHYFMSFKSIYGKFTEILYEQRDANISHHYFMYIYLALYH